MKRFITTIFTIITINNVAYGAAHTNMPDDPAALGVKTIWNAYNDRRHIFENENLDQSEAKANVGKKTEQINNFIATATVAKREATNLEKNRILTTIIAGEIIARTHSTTTKLCYDTAIAFDTSHALYGHHTALKLTQEIAKSCMEHYEFSKKFKFTKSELEKLKSLFDITGVIENIFETLLHHAYYTHHHKTIIVMTNASATFLEDYGIRGARMVAGYSEHEEENAADEIAAVIESYRAERKKKMSLPKAKDEITAAVDSYRTESKKMDLPGRIRAFFEKEKLEKKYNGIDPVKALEIEARDFISKIDKLTARHGGIMRRNVVSTSMADLQAHMSAPQPNFQHQVNLQQEQMKIYSELVLYDIQKLKDLVTIAVGNKELTDQLDVIMKQFYKQNGFGIVSLPESLLFSLCQPIGYSNSVSYYSNQSY